MSAIRVFLVDDHAVLRQGLRLLISDQHDMTVVGELDRGRGVADALEGLDADVVVMDISMPDLGGAAAAAVVRQKHPRTKILALSRHSEQAYVQQMLAAGCSGYVLKQTPAEVLIEAIRSVAGGSTYIDPAVATKLAHSPAASSVSTSGDAALSEREQEVATMVVYGHTNKEIAERLGITVRTVETHKSNIMTKLGVENRADLVRFAISKGWLET